MSRTGYSKDQQNQLKQLIYESSIARLPTVEIIQIANDKLGMLVTQNWIQKIRRRLKQGAERDFKHLVSSNFGYKHEYLKRVQEIEHIQKKLWDIVNKDHPTKEDLIRLKGLSELKLNTVFLSDLYKYLPEVEISHFTLKVNHKHNNDNNWMFPFVDTNKYEDLDNLDIDKEPTLSEEEKVRIRKGEIIIVGRDSKTGELIIDDKPDDWNDVMDE